MTETTRSEELIKELEARIKFLEQEIVELKRGRPEVPALLQPIKGGGSGHSGVA